MGFRHLNLNDLLYSHNFDEAISRMKIGFNYESYSLTELLDMIEISNFFDDKNKLNDNGKKIIEDNSNTFIQINSTIAKYFNSITPEKIKSDLQIINDNKELLPFGYYNNMIKFKSYKKLNDNEFKDLIDKNLFNLDIALSSKDIVKTFETVIRFELI